MGRAIYGHVNCKRLLNQDLFIQRTDDVTQVKMAMGFFQYSLYKCPSNVVLRFPRSFVIYFPF